jgi:hypothetical protein
MKVGSAIFLAECECIDRNNVQFKLAIHSMTDRRMKAVANLAAERWRFSLWPTIAIMVIYFF